MENIREAGSERLHPSLLSSRLYYLIQLRKRIKKVIDLYIKDKNYDVVVDYGCGNIPYKPLFDPYIKEYKGADLSINKTADLIITDGGKIDLPDNYADVVLSTQVLEHVESPVSYLEEANRILKKESLLILTTHGYWMYHPDPNDYWRWTSAGLKKIVEESGYEIIHFEGIMGRSSIGLQLFQDGIFFKLPKIIKTIFAMLMQIPIALFDKINRQSAIDNDASTYIVVAKKNK